MKTPWPSQGKSVGGGSPFPLPIGATTILINDDH
jgi:hypothetical protein